MDYWATTILKHKFMQIARFQYITNYQSDVSHFEQVKQVIEGGADWIQYRPKDMQRDEILKEGQRIAKFCKQNNVQFIMNDWVDVAKELKADGVHLGKNDLKPSEARKILGDKMIIGGTANTFEDIISLVEQGVDYIGLGPFRFTQTKKNLSPVLGIDGYKNIVQKMNAENMNIPFVAIGGITADDIKPLLNVGVYGIALSSLISEAKDISEMASIVYSLTNNRDTV